MQISRFELIEPSLREIFIEKATRAGLGAEAREEPPTEDWTDTEPTAGVGAGSSAGG